jgi:hypothetical protein
MAKRRQKPIILITIIIIIIIFMKIANDSQTAIGRQAGRQAYQCRHKLCVVGMVMMVAALFRVLCVCVSVHLL